MADGTVQRRLAAILAADVAGFSALMERDEEGTYSRIGTLRREVIEPRLSEHQGRLIKTTGDGFLAEFASPIAALRCALALQSAQAHDLNALRLRIGLNLGDVIIEQGGDVYGEGVNVAARLEGLADPGGILISGKIHSEVEGKVIADFEDRGEQQVKNITRPVRIYAVRSATAPINSAGTITAIDNSRPLVLPDKPSIAVLPFQNMSGDPEQEYFADGMVEDIITALSRFKSLFVIARNSSFTYKGKAVDIKQVGRELGVRHVLEGSVRKSGNRVRITGQLIDATTGAHLWADKFEGELHDVFDLQDTVATSVVGAIAPRLIAATAEIVKRKPPESWASYDFYLRGIALFNQRTLDKTEQALDFFRNAIELDQEFGLAYVRAANSLFNRPQLGGRPITHEERSELLQLSTRALALAGDDEYVLATAATIFTYWNNEAERGSDLSDRALAINPNSSTSWNYRGWISVALGEGARALDAFDRAVRLNPADDVLVTSAMQGTISALNLLERNSDALEMVNRVLARRPTDLRAWFSKYAIDVDPARKEDAACHIRALYPGLRRSTLKQMFNLTALRNPKRRKLLKDAIGSLCLPE